MKTLNEFLECKVDFYSYEGEGLYILTSLKVRMSRLK